MRAWQRGAGQRACFPQGPIEVGCRGDGRGLGCLSWGAGSRAFCTGHVSRKEREDRLPPQGEGQFSGGLHHAPRRLTRAASRPNKARLTGLLAERAEGSLLQAWEQFPSDTIRANGTRLRRIPHTSRGFRRRLRSQRQEDRLLSLGPPRFPRALTSTRSASTAPTGSASPTPGKRAVRSSRRTEGGSCSTLAGPCYICLIRPNGTGLRALTDHSGTGVRDGSPDFSPNGRRVVFTRVTDIDVGPKRSGMLLRSGWTEHV